MTCHTLQYETNDRQYLVILPRYPYKQMIWLTLVTLIKQDV